MFRTIVSSKERKLKKGSGYHLNLMVLGILNVVLSGLGMPWVCCAAVRSITHTNRLDHLMNTASPIETDLLFVCSLTVMSSKLAPGEKPHIEGVREQRVTVFIVNAFLGQNILHSNISLLLLIFLFQLFQIFRLVYFNATSTERDSPCCVVRYLLIHGSHFTLRCSVCRSY